jgi:hypothetical protein
MWNLAALLLLLPAPPFVTEGIYARQVLPASGAPADAIAHSRIIYLNHTGALLHPGETDSRTNYSSIVSETTQFPAWNTDDKTWADTVACFQEMWSPFDVQVVDQDPGNVPHMEALFGGTPQDVGLPAHIAGVSPFTEDCAIIENSIVFEFTDAIADIPSRLACEIMSQEVAHSYGLDHELLASDPMTYLRYNGDRAFQDETVSCGEFMPRPCGFQAMPCRPSQNSVQVLTDRIGPAGGHPGDPPTQHNSGSGDLIGGCSTTNSPAGLVLAFGLVGLVRLARLRHR